MATIYDVAKKAGVSASTVSRVLNGGHSNSVKARRVREVAKALNYIPSKTARRMRKPSSELIALMIPDITNPFFPLLARGVEDVAQANGYSVVLCNTDDDPEKESHYADIVIAEEMAGVILAAGSGSGNVDDLVNRGVHAVTIDRQLSMDVDSVIIDNRSAGRLATAEMFNRGYERVACIAGPKGELNDDRMQAWREEVRQHDLEDPDSLLVHSDYRVAGGAKAMDQLLDSPSRPDAVVVTNNLMAVGALRALADWGISTRDFGVSVVGEIPFLIDESSSIYQLSLPANRLGATAAELLLARIDGDTSPPHTIALRAFPAI